MYEAEKWPTRLDPYSGFGTLIRRACARGGPQKCQAPRKPASKLFRGQGSALTAFNQPSDREAGNGAFPQQLHYISTSRSPSLTVTEHLLEAFTVKPSTQATQTKNIVILGGSYGGILTWHYLLKHVLPLLARPDDYRLVLVGLASQVVCTSAYPRTMISESFFDQGKLFVDIDKCFSLQTPQVKPLRPILTIALALLTVKGAGWTSRFMP